MTYKRVFLDANILVDIFDKKRDTYKESEYIYFTLVEKKIQICTSCDIATTVYYLTTKATSRENALRAMDIIDQTMTLVPFSNEQFRKTIKLMKKDDDFKDFEDTLQYILAKEIQADAIVSNDKRFISKDVPLFTSKEFVKELMTN